MKKLELNEVLEKTSDLKNEKKIWFVSIIARPNAWKSTFINTLLWEKVSIVSKTPQTTRRKVLAIHNDEDSQIIFFDNPWIHKSEKIFNEKINSEATTTIKSSDLILYFIDSSRPYGEEEKHIEQILDQVNKPIIKVYTKSDLKRKIEIKESENTVKISSIDKSWFDELLSKIKSYLKEWQMLYPEDIFTQQDMYFRISEVIREKVFIKTKQELPHSVFIWVDEIEESDNLLKIVAYVYSETESQKYIIIWKWWNLIKEIWMEARKDLEEIFGKKVFLALRAKRKEKWRRNENIIKGILS